MYGQGRLHLRPWRAGDEDAFEPRPDFVAERAMNAWNWKNGPPGPTWALLDRDQNVLGIGGGERLLGDAWRMWSQLSDLPARDFPAAIILAGKVMDHLKKDKGAKFFFAAALATSGGAIRCLVRLGFERAELQEADEVVYQVMRKTA